MTEPTLTKADQAEDDLYAEDDLTFDPSEEDSSAARPRPWLRSQVLKYASSLTSTPGNADAVTANARPLLAWLEAADSDDDMDSRWRAMSQQHVNEYAADPDDNPERFLGEASKLYAFTIAGPES
jgi:hypothetical protein